MQRRREGVNQLTVLSAIAGLTDDEGPRQKDIAEATALTKGAVSNNCTKLVEEGLLDVAEERYVVDGERLLDLYRTHLEDHLRRRRVPEEYAHLNDVRTATKRRMPELMSDGFGDVLIDILRGVVESAADDGQLSTLRDAFHRADQVVTALAESAYRSGDHPHRTPLMMLAASMDHAPEHVQEDLTKRAIHEMAEELTEDILDA